MKWFLLFAVPAVAGTSFVLSRDGGVDWPWAAGSGASASAAPSNTAASTAPAARRDTRERPVDDPRRLVFANGVVEGKHRSAALTFEVEGRIESIDVREGQPVQAGQPLARLNADLPQARLEAARAELYAAQSRRQRLANAASREARDVALAQLKVAEVRVEQTARDFDRGFELRKNGAITPQQWDEIQNRHSVALAEAALARARAAEVSAAARADELQVADAEIAQARAAVQQAQVMLDKTVLRAPLSGLVLRIDAEPGELVTLYDPRPILTLANVEETRVRAYVEELDALAVSPGDRAYVTTDSRPGHRYAATIIECGPAMHPKHVFSNKPAERVDVKVREIVLRLEDARELVVGLPVDVFIERSARAESRGPRPEDRGPPASGGPHEPRTTRHGQASGSQPSTLHTQPVSTFEFPPRHTHQDASR